MKQRLLATLVIAAFYLLPLMAQEHISSPNGKIQLSVGLKSGRPYYELKYHDRNIFNTSFLGYKLSDGNLDSDFKIISCTRTTKDETWQQVWGEEEFVKNHYNELTIHLQQKKGLKRKLNIVFRIFDDGIGFRYIIPEQKTLNTIIINEEETQFALAHDAEAWSIPSNHTEYFEGIYRKSLISTKDTVCTPLTIEYEPDIYLSIHEAALNDYASLNLTPRGNTLTSALTPWSNGIKVYGNKNLMSPWRTVIVVQKATDLLLSRIMLNLNDPCKIEDTSWIKPGKYIGIWWSIHKKKNTWEMGPNHGATTANVKRYIDFAARHGFSGILAEGWNPGWGNGEKITYQKSYPDFNIEEVNQYARSKGVRFIGHMESWGNSKLIETEMDSVFRWFHSMDMNTVKTGYVGHKFDGKELSKSQYGIRHYRKVIETAARYHIMINNHEPAMPTGIQRTWPNLMTQEGVRGQEYNAWDKKGGNPPEHTATLPYTRGLAGPTDFTPAIFNFSEVIKGTRPHSTLAKQLAEFVIIYSPLQMAADEIENYEGQPALTFIENCPTTWSQMVVPNGKIGQYITIARKERNGDSWFLGSLTDNKARELDVRLDFLDADKKYTAIIYEDGPEADFETNPMAMSIRQIKVDCNSTLHLKLARSGGAAVQLKVASKL